jgi:hypothetical protein
MKDEKGERREAEKRIISHIILHFDGCFSSSSFILTKEVLWINLR